MLGSRRFRWVLVLELALPFGVRAQQKPPTPAAQAASLVSDALDLERDERYPEAAEIYRDALRSEPVNLSALVGLERVLKASKLLPAIMPQLGRALARDQRNPLLRAIELRVWATAGPADSVSAAAQRWLVIAPGSPDPYREWAAALMQAGKLDEGQRVLP